MTASTPIRSKITYYVYVGFCFGWVFPCSSSIYRILIRVTTQSRTKTPAAISQDCRLGVLVWVGALVPENIFKIDIFVEHKRLISKKDKRLLVFFL